MGIRGMGAHDSYEFLVFLVPENHPQALKSLVPGFVVQPPGAQTDAVEEKKKIDPKEGAKSRSPWICPRKV